MHAEVQQAEFSAGQFVQGEGLCWRVGININCRLGERSSHSSAEVKASLGTAKTDSSMNRQG